MISQLALQVPTVSLPMHENLECNIDVVVKFERPNLYIHGDLGVCKTISEHQAEPFGLWCDVTYGVFL